MDSIYPYLNKELDCIMSIGPAPQYNIKSLIYEILIYENFPVKEFYGLIVKPEITGFIRPTAKFGNFDSFVKAMWNDIEVSKKQLKI